MNNRKLKFAFVPMLLAGALTGCFGGGGGGGDEPLDDTKTQLKVAAVRSGVEDGWLQDLAARFMEKYKDYSFEEGKKGIQITVHGEKDQYNGDVVKDTITNDDHQIYCIENAKYAQFANSKEVKVLNLKDIVNTKGSDGDEFYTDSKSIIDRMDPQFRKAFEKDNGDVYMIPYYESFASFQYDKDVFNSPKRTSNKSFYFKRSDLVIAGNSNLKAQYANPDVISPVKDNFNLSSATFNLDQLFCDINEDASHRSLGPDGISGTFDDGLPQTFMEFQILGKFMRKAEYTPILGNSTYNYYFADMFASMWANEEGLENINKNFSWEGTATDLVKISNGKIVRDNDGNPVTESLAINDKNAVELHRQEGYLKSLEFSKILVGMEPNTTNAFKAAQKYLANTKFSTSSKNDYCMLVDGNWWENETKGTFSPEPSNEHYRLNRNFGFFNLPKSTAKKWLESQGEVTYYNINSSAVFMNKSLESRDKHLMKAAKAFFFYINSNEGMSAFTTSTSISRPYEYSLTTSDLTKVSSYGKDMMELRNHFSDLTGDFKGYNICSTYPLSKVVADKEDQVHKYNWNYQIKSYEKDKANPFNIMKAKSSYTGESYFVESYNFIKELFDINNGIR